MIERPTEKVTIRLFVGDKEELQKLFPHVGYNKPIRHLIHNFIRRVGEKAMRKQPKADQQISVELPAGFIPNRKVD